jgi:heme/copper-type cytochrome/quinol oxidase subunit 2
MAIISIFCCWPLAIPAIIFATQVQSKWAMGDFAGAQDSANKARTFSLIAIILGVTWVVLWLLFTFVFGFTFLNVFNTTIRR